MVKWEALKEHKSTWRTNGLADLRYSIIKVEHLDCITNGVTPVTKVEKCTSKARLTVDVKLNGNHWSNDKCGLDFVWEG